MIEAILSSYGFGALIASFAIGAVGALALRKSDTAANVWSNAFAVLGSAWGIVYALLAVTAVSAPEYIVDASAAFPLLSVSFHIDKLSAFFIFVISLIAFLCSIYGMGYVRHFYKKYNIGSLGFFYNFFIAGMLLVVSASNALVFLIAWEIMSVASYFLVVYERNDHRNVRAGFLYFVMTHIGTAFILLAFLVMYKFTGSFQFAAIAHNIASIPPFAASVVFVLALAGFGTKAGIIPLHIWLPDAHPAAPSHVSALMSGVMIKTGIYMMIKIFLDVFTDIPLWWGLTVLVLGAVSSLLGVLYALTEHDLKRLLAYHSIENIGIILLGVGSAMVFSSSGMLPLAALGIVAALFHTLNHATFKSLLFLSAGAVVSATHTRNIEEYGGLIKRMPQTAFFFLIGSMAISALPPFNGFFSEWLTFQALFGGILALPSAASWIFVLAVGALALTGGLALACFVKAVGAVFLARPRSEEARHAKESSFSMRTGMAFLALLALVFGVFSGSVSLTIGRVARDIGKFGAAELPFAVSPLEQISVQNGFASASAPAIAMMFIVAACIAALGLRAAYRKQKVVIGETWDCGTPPTSRAEITATAFSRSIIMIFKGILKPTKQTGIEYRDATARYFPKARTITLGISDIYRAYLYEPLQVALTKFSERVKTIQSGNINAYVLYIFVALLVLLVYVIL
ncbi:hydrogenase 4 subunit B [Candidatus Azambacteria bacterium]|nr:hydrogenase 4 subunit B [Candidatus Azambacteria bacterium]